jgi:hypothetical protein
MKDEERLRFDVQLVEEVEEELGVGLYCRED